MSKTLAGCKLPWTLWKRTGAYRNVSFSQGMYIFSGQQTKQPTTVDFIDDYLTGATTSAAVLKVVSDHYKKMNSEQVVRALKTIFAIQKNDQINTPITKILNHPGLEKLCVQLKVHSGVLDISDVIDALKTISYLKVPSNSTITQVLLQLLRHNINSLNIQQILFLEFLISDFQKTPLVEALIIAFPLVFEIYLPKKMDRRNASHMAECLWYAIRHKLSSDTLNVIIYALKKYEGEFEASTAKSIIISLCNLQKRDDIEDLYRKSVTDMVVHVDQLSFFDISFTLYKMAHQYKKSYPFYYQEVFFDTVANQCIEMKANLRNSMYVMRQLARLRHFHKNLLDYVSKLVYDDPHQPCHPIDCFSLVVALALTDYKPVHWDAIRDWIRNARDLGLENKKEILWIRFAASLCVLGIYKADVLSRTLSSSYVEHLLSKGFMSDFENYFTIWKMLNIYNPDLADLLPSNLEPKLLVDRINLVKDYPLEAPLEKCLGGPEFLLTKLYSKLGDIIDHAMVFDRNGCPVNLNPVTFIEDIDLHNDNQLVLILDLHESHYTINDKRLRLSVIKSIEILESTVPNCNVIPISNDSWNELEEFERLPYLTQKIKEKLDLDISVSHQIV